MNDISRWLATFLLNAIWQITAITIFAFVCAKLLRRMPSRYAHRAWVLAMFACLLIPLTTVLIQHALGISVFSLQLAAENATDLRQFAGTWECKYKGRTFFTLKMAVKDGVLGGTAVHSKRVAWVDGEIIPDTDETTPDKIFDTNASRQELLIKIADGPNDSDPIALSFKLTGKDEADAKLIVEKMPNAPAQKKPWHFQRVSNAQ